MDQPAIRKQYKLSSAMERELKYLLKGNRVRHANRSLIALTKRGLAIYDSNDPYREGWELSEEGKRIAKILSASIVIPVI
jgi:hypothetical protein